MTGSSTDLRLPSGVIWLPQDTQFKGLDGLTC